MKKFLLLPALAASLTAAHAQSIPAGTISLGGSLGYSRNTNEYHNPSGGSTSSGKLTRNLFSIAPAAGYFLKDNLAVGLNLSYRIESTSVENTTTPTPSPAPYTAPALDPNTSLSVGPFVQYYKLLTEQFGFTGTLSAGYYTARDHQYGTGIEQVTFKSSGYNGALTPGLVFFPIPKLGLSTSFGYLGYSHFSQTRSDAEQFESTDSSFGANFGLNQFVFGGTYYLGRK